MTDIINIKDFESETDFCIECPECGSQSFIIILEHPIAPTEIKCFQCTNESCCYRITLTDLMDAINGK